MKNLRINILIILIASCVSVFAQPKLKPLSEKKMLQTIMPMEKKGRWGYANEKGKFIIKNVFDVAEPFDDWYARVCYGGRWGLLSRNGTFLLEPSYDEIHPFAGKTYTLVRLGNKWGTIACDGTTILPTEYDSISPRDGFDAIILERDGLYGTLAPNGDVDIAPIYKVNEFNGRYAIVSCGDKMGTVNNRLQTIIPAYYKDIHHFDNGLLSVSNGEYEALFDESGHALMDFTYEELTKVNNGFVIGKSHDKYGILRIEPNNLINNIVPPQLSDKPKLSSLPAVFFYNGSVTIITDYSHYTYSLPNGVSPNTNSDQPLPADSDVMTCYTLDENFTLYAVNGFPVYILHNYKHCTWAVNKQYHNYSESPINCKILTQPIKKEHYFKDVENIYDYIHMDFEAEWPIGAVDKRVNVALLRKQVMNNLATLAMSEFPDHKPPHFGEEAEYEQLESFLFDLCGGQPLPYEPSDIEWGEGTNSFWLQLKQQECELEDCILYEYKLDVACPYGPCGSREYKYYNLLTGKPVSINDLYDANQRARMVSVLNTCPVDEDGEVIVDAEYDGDAVTELPDNFVIRKDTIFFYFDWFRVGMKLVLVGVRLADLDEETMIKSFIVKMYNNDLYENDYFIEKHCSPHLLKKLKDSYERQYDSCGGKCYALWDFRTVGNGDGKGYFDEYGEWCGVEEDNRVISIESSGDGWYTYEFFDGGYRGKTRIKASVQNGKVVMDDLEKLYDECMEECQREYENE